MIKNFLFLKLTDPEVCSFLWELREIFEKEKKSRTSIHITVRGPNKNSFSDGVIKNLYKKIADDSIVIQSAGRFENGIQHIVYIKVNSINLYKIWRKPDYPKEVYGINPHITLYVGPDKEYADCIYDFLKKENVDLLCNSFELVPYQTKQVNIPNLDIDLVGEGFGTLVDRGRLSVNILERAKAVATKCKNDVKEQQELF